MADIVWAPTDRLQTVTLDPQSVRDLVPDEVQERRVAIDDLVRDNHFAPQGKNQAQKKVFGPYGLHLSLIDNHLVFDIRSIAGGAHVATHIMSLSPFKQDLRHYATVKQNYYEAIKYYGTAQIEALDMGRRKIHNEASEKLIERLEGKIALDLGTARRLFVLISSLKLTILVGSQAEDKTLSVLFVCVMNAVRSPIAAALARKYFMPQLFARSAGVRSGQMDAMVTEIMDELGIDLTLHTPHSLDEIIHDRFDLVIALSKQAYDVVKKHTQFAANNIEYWPTKDPTQVEGTKEQRLLAYRALRETLSEKIIARFSAELAG